MRPGVSAGGTSPPPQTKNQNQKSNQKSSMPETIPGRINGKFAPGTSGNPGGRPKAVREVEELARQKTTTAIETLDAICGDKEAPHAARVSAAVALLNRAWGTPRDTIDASFTNSTSSPAQASDESLLANVADARAILASVLGTGVLTRTSGSGEGDGSELGRDPASPSNPKQPD
jgi:hypothetical protein